MKNAFILWMVCQIVARSIQNGDATGINKWFLSSSHNDSDNLSSKRFISYKKYKIFVKIPFKFGYVSQKSFEKNFR